MPENKMVEVPVSFIREAHLAACTAWKRKIEAILPPDFFKPNHKVGQRFNVTMSWGVEQYILAHVKNSCAGLISLSDGNRFRDPVQVANVDSITPEEMEQIIPGKYKYSLIEK